MTTSNQPLYYERVLAAVVDFLVLSGLSPSGVQDLADAVIAKARKKVQQLTVVSKATSGIETIPAVVLHRWHRDRELLDSEANPIPLKLYGTGPSVETLVREEQPTTSVRQIIGDMKTLGLIRQCSKNRYVPKSRVATIATLHPVLIEHVAHSLLRLLETVEHNVNAHGKNMSLIERFTHIPDLPLKEVSEFTSFSQAHGSSFLASVDDWLESRRQSAKTGNSCSAGIHVFAYVGRSKR